MQKENSPPTSTDRADRLLRDEQEAARKLELLRGFIQEHRGFAACGTDFTVLLTAASGCALYFGGDRWGQEACTGWHDLSAVYAGPDYTIGLLSNGCVRFAGRDHDGLSSGINAMSGVRLVSCGARHAAAILWGGRVVCAGNNGAGQCETDGWTDIVDVCCGERFTAGLTSKGTVLVAGGSKLLRMETESWNGIAGIFADSLGHDVYAIKADGHPAATAALPRSVAKWSNLASLTVSGRGLWGLTAVGELLSRYPLPDGDDDMARDVVAMAAGPFHAVTVDRTGRAESLGLSVRKGRAVNKALAGVTDLGAADIPTGLRLFDDYDALTEAREKNAEKQVQADRLYQVSITQSQRLGRRLSCGGRLTACIDYMERVMSTGGLRACAEWSDVIALSCGQAHLLALHRDGHVSADGNQVGGCCDVSEWRHVSAVLARACHSLALTEDGRVLFTGINDHGQGDVKDWHDIALLRGSETSTAAVDRSGKIHAAGECRTVEKQLTGPAWSDLCDIAVSRHLIAGLSRSGRVTVCGIGASDEAGQDLLSELEVVNTWRDVRAITLGDRHIIGLCYGGRVLSAGSDDAGQCAVSEWPRMTAIVCTSDATIGLGEDGIVRCAGRLKNAPTDGILWRDIIAVAAGPDHAVGMTRFGRVLSCGLDTDGQCAGTAPFGLFRDLRQYDGLTRYDEHNGIEAEQVPDAAMI